MYNQTEELEELVVKTNGNGGVTSKVKAQKHERGTLETASYPKLEVLAKQVKAQVEARLRAAYEKMLSTPRQEVAEPQDWWDIIAIGPIQPAPNSVPPSGFFAGQLLPHQVIRVGEPAFIATVLLLNPVGPSIPSAADIMAGLALPFEIQYRTGNLDTWSLGPGFLNANLPGAFTPVLPFAVNVLSFIAAPGSEGNYEMNISARVFGAGGSTAAPFSGFAREVIDIDAGLLFPAPGVQQDTGVRFQIYGPAFP